MQLASIPGPSAVSTSLAIRPCARRSSTLRGSTRCQISSLAGILRKKRSRTRGPRMGAVPLSAIVLSVSMVGKPIITKSKKKQHPKIFLNQGNGSQSAVPEEIVPQQQTAVYDLSAQYTQEARFLDKCVTFRKDWDNFLNALKEISDYLPPSGESALRAMQVVNEMRKWVFRTASSVHELTGHARVLDTNLLQELEFFLAEAQAGISKTHMEKNIKVTLENLEKLQPAVNKLKDILTKARSHATMQCTSEEGGEKKIQLAVMDCLTKLGGAKEVEAIVDDLKRLRIERDSAKDKVNEADKECNQLQGRISDLNCQFVVYDSIAKDAESRLETLQRRATERDNEAARVAREAAHTENSEEDIGISLGFLHVIWGKKKGDRARAKADRLRSVAQDAMKMLKDSGVDVAKASTEAANIKGKLVAEEKQLLCALKKRNAAYEEYSRLDREFLAKRDDSYRMREEYGNISLAHVEEVRSLSQNLPALLLGQDSVQQGMFAAFDDIIVRHERLQRCLQSILNVGDEGFEDMLPSLRRVIMHTIRDSSFYGQAFESQLGGIQKAAEGFQLSGTEQGTALHHGTSEQEGKHVTLDDDPNERLF